MACKTALIKYLEYPPLIPATYKSVAEIWSFGQQFLQFFELHIICEAPLRSQEVQCIFHVRRWPSANAMNKKWHL